MHTASKATKTPDAHVEQFIDEPDTFFLEAGIPIHRMPREMIVEAHKRMVVRRFDEQRSRIPMLAKLAESQDIASLSLIDDVVPLLFEHTMYKSYPIALLAGQQFDKLTGWLGKLSMVDLSEVDVSSCESIDSWLETLAEHADLDVVFSSGTSGTMSFFPWSTRDLEMKWHCHYLQIVDALSDDSGARAATPFHLVGNVLRTRRNYRATYFTQGNEDTHVHMRAPDGYSADMGWLAARMRLAAARGDASRVEVPPYLLARRAELEQARLAQQERDSSWFRVVEDLQGERIYWVEYPYEVHKLAASRLESGEHWSFSPDSLLVLAGGSKGHALPEGWRTTIERFLEINVRTSYGMSELSFLGFECANRRYHLSPWVVPFVLDPDTSELLPRTGVQRGRAAYFDGLPRDHWGGFISGDEIEVDFSTPCECGASTYHLAPDVRRLADQRGGDDKISCTASPRAHADAMEFLIGY